MGHKIWTMLDQYAGRWVAVDKLGEVVDHSDRLEELRRRAGPAIKSLTLVYAAQDGAA